jgi:hypothetical protein
MKAIRQWFAKFADEHPFALAWGIVILAVTFVGRLNDIASWKEKFDWILRNGTRQDPATHVVTSSPWLFGLVFAVVVTWIIWLFLFAQATILRSRALKAKNERQTTAYKTLKGMMSAASRIRDRLNPPQAVPQKSIKSVHMVYSIRKDFTTEVVREYEIEAVNETVHYWNLSNRPSEYADEVEYLDDIDFKVREGSGIGEIAYLPTMNDPRDKRVTFYFLPRLEPGNPPRKVILSFTWPRFMKKLGDTGEEEISFNLSSVKPIERIEIEVYLERGNGRNLECATTGPDYAGTTVQKRKHPSLGWDGFIYTIENAPSGTNRYTLTAKLLAV